MHTTLTKINAVEGKLVHHFRKFKTVTFSFVTEIQTRHRKFRQYR